MNTRSAVHLTIAWLIICVHVCRSLRMVRMENTSDPDVSAAIFALSTDRKHVVNLSNCKRDSDAISGSPVSAVITDFRTLAHFHDVLLEDAAAGGHEFRVHAYSVSSSLLPNDKNITSKAYLRLFAVLAEGYFNFDDGGQHVHGNNTPGSPTDPDVAARNSDFRGLDEYCIRRLDIRRHLNFKRHMKFGHKFSGRLLALVFTGLEYTEQVCFQHSVRYTAIKPFIEDEALFAISRFTRSVIADDFIDSNATCAYRLMDASYPVYMNPVTLRPDLDHVVVKLRNSVYLKGVVLLTGKLEVGVVVELSACAEVNLSFKGGSDELFKSPQGGASKSDNDSDTNWVRDDQCVNVYCKQEALEHRGGGGVGGKPAKEFTKVVCKMMKKKTIIVTYLRIMFDKQRGVPLKLYKLSIMGMLTNVTSSTLNTYFINKLIARNKRKRSKDKLSLSALILSFLLIVTPCVFYSIWLVRKGCLHKIRHHNHDVQVQNLESDLDERLSEHLNSLLASNSSGFNKFHSEFKNIPDRFFEVDEVKYDGG